MAEDITLLRSQLQRLRNARASGTHRLQIDGQMTEFRTDAEMASAIADLERRLAAAEGRPPARITYFLTSKGL